MFNAGRNAALAILMVLAALGVADGLYLMQVHLDLVVGTSGAGGACHVFSETGCNITGGRYGAIAGIPVAAIGAAGGLAVFLLAVFGFLRRDFDADPLRPLLWLATGFAVLASAAMATASFIEGQFCPFCVIWYALNIGQFACAWVALDRPVGRALRDGLRSVVTAPGLSALAIFAVSLGLFGWLYSAQHAAAEKRRPPTEVKAATTELRLRPSVARKQSKAWLASGGSGAPQVSIVELSDFECPYCRVLWDTLSGLLDETELRVEVLYVHFPLDSACNPLLPEPMHPNACRAAAAAECAGQQGKFWEMGGKLFHRQEELSADRINEFASELGLDLGQFLECIGAAATLEAIAADVAEGIRLNIQGTPTLYVNGRLISGVPNKSALLKAIDEVLATAPQQ